VEANLNSSISDFTNTERLHLSGLIRTASHPDIQKIRITEFFFESRLHWLFEVGGGGESTNDCLRLYIYLRTNETLIRDSLHIFDIWGGNFRYKKMWYSYS